MGHAPTAPYAQLNANSGMVLRIDAGQPNPKAIPCQHRQSGAMCEQSKQVSRLPMCPSQLLNLRGERVNNHLT